jgi:hypothetical protein
LPDPTGLAGTLAAVQNGNLFRDMSGIAQTAALAQAALQASAAGATAVGDQAGQNLKTVMDNVTERERIKAQIASSGATGNRPAKNVTEEGARVNHARSLDARAASGSSGIGTADGSGTASDGVIDSPSPQFGRSAEVTQPSIEQDLFDRQTGGVAAKLANQLVDTDEANGLIGSGGTGSATPLAHMAFDHILLESLDSAASAMVPGVVPASPSMLTTPFYNADVVGTVPDPTLQQALTSLINSTPAYKNAGKNIAISLVDLSGANKLSPKYAGFNDLTNFYGGSVNKITGLLGVYQLLAEANELLQANPAISDAAGLESTLKALWTQAGIAAKHHPLVSLILDVQPGSPSTAIIRPELIARLNRISDGNQNGSTSIVLLKFPFIGSTLLAYGLFSPANKGGLWSRKAFGSIDYLGKKLSLPDWSARENPHPKTETDNINAVSVAQFYTLAAQRRMIDEATSKAVLGHLESGGCTAVIDVTPLSASGQVSTKCGIFPEDGAWTHNTVHFKETATLREFVVVILTKNHTFGVMKNLFKDLVSLVP